MIDQALLGSTVAKLMDSIEESPPSEDVVGELTIEAVGIVVVMGDGEGTWTRTWCSHERRFEQLGLFSAGVECVKNGD